jgi:NO-binding membrane sensor protein with MHYT domain
MIRLERFFRRAGRELPMAEIHHFAYGWITPIMAYCLSVLGSLLGLICTSRAQSLPTARQRISWLLLAAVAIGGTGIWVMHFMAMIGFGVVGTDVRYDVEVTALSVVVAVVVVGLGLFLAGLGRPKAWKIAIGGVLAGLGVNAMHYMGMAAMRLDGEISYDRIRVMASIVIAVVAATVALWLSVTVRTGAAIFGSAMVMGVAVTGMHYTGMSAMSVHLSEHGNVSGVSSTNLIAPIVLAVILVVMGLVYSVLAAPTDEDRAGAAYIAARMSGQSEAPSGIWGTADSEPAAGRFVPRSAAGAVPSPPPASGSMPPPATSGSAVGAGGDVGGSAPSPAGGFASAFGVARGAADRPVPGDPAPAGLGASLRATESFAPEAGASGGRWAGLTEQVHPVVRPITERQYGGQPADEPQPTDQTMPLPQNAPDPAQLPRRNTRDPWAPPRTPTRRD